MPILWEPTGEVGGEPVRGVRVSAEDWARAHECRHALQGRRFKAGDDARCEACDTEGGAMTEKRMESSEPDGGVVAVALVVMACASFVAGVLVGWAAL